MCAPPIALIWPTVTLFWLFPTALPLHSRPRSPCNLSIRVHVRIAKKFKY